MRAKLYSVGIGILCFWFLLLPFDHPLFASIANGIQSPFKHALLAIDPNLQFETDTYGTYLLGLLAIIFGTLASFILNRSWNEDRLKFLFQNLLVFVIAYFLLVYGWVKITGSQFMKPEPNVLYTPFGKLSKDIVFWSLIGASYPLSFGIGLVEIGLAFGLVFQRTRIVASFLSALLFIAIFSINCFFDISVKFLSGSLLLFSLMLFSTFWSTFRILFGLPMIPLNPTTSIRAGFRKPIIWGILLVCMTIVPSAIDRMQHAAITLKSQCYRIDNSTQFKRVFIHSAHYLILETHSDEFYDFPCVQKKSSITAIDRRLSITNLNNQPELQLNGKTHRLHLEKIEKFPLIKNGFHWFGDEFHN